MGNFSKKKSHLALVEKTPQPPGKLGAAGQALWAHIQGGYDIRDCGGVELLMRACMEADRVAEMKGIIDEDGARIFVKGVPRDHPLIKHELAAQAFIVKTLRLLGVTDESVQALGRPPKDMGWTPGDDEDED
jgi:hypothetical protein